MLIALASSTPANAGQVDFEYENFRMTGTGAAEVVLKFINKTGEHKKYVIAECAVLDADYKAISVITVAAKNVPAGGIAYAKNYGPQDTRTEHVSCRVVD